MKKVFFFFLGMFIFLEMAFADGNDELPLEFYLSEHYLSYTTSYDLGTKTQRLGTVYRRVFSFLLTYDFYDNAGNKLATADPKFFSFTTKFNVKDINNQSLGTVEEDFYLFFPTFSIYGPGGKKRLASAVMNFWGTQFNISDPASGAIMATLSRSFFRIKNNWTIRITNPSLFYSKEMDNRLFMTVLAFQGDMEYIKKRKPNPNPNQLKHSPAQTISLANLNKLMFKVNELASQFAIDLNDHENIEALEAEAKELDARFDETQDIQAQRSIDEKISVFIDFCLREAALPETSPMKRQAILKLLQFRLHDFSLNTDA